MASKEENYRQCKLSKQIDEEKQKHTTSWIPEQYAKVGNICELYIGFECQDGWQILEVGSERMSKTQVREKSRANKDFTKSIK